MCGIVGFVSLPHARARITEQVLNAMTSALYHRGPDDEGHYWSEEVGLANRRLSIIDLSPGGHMPIWNETKTVVVVQNGEIYNYKPLRKVLLERGHQFVGHSDTEVILHLYEDVGEGCFALLDGMYTIAIWDSTKKQLVLARDRFGEKPLYYFESPNGFAFASELKSLVLHPDIRRVLRKQFFSQFLTLGYVLAPITPYEHVWKLMPGSYLIYDQESGKTQVEEYWRAPDFSAASDGRTEDECIKEFKELFFESVASRMVSDVPVGAFLSGGIDSSLVVAAMSRIQNEQVRTFSIGFPSSAAHNENVFAEEVANHLGVSHTTLRVDLQSVLEIIEQLPMLWDEPMGDPALMGAYLITKRARADGFKVMLSGDGGDELFLGYPVYNWLEWYGVLYRAPLWIRRGISAGVSLAAVGLGKSWMEKGAHSLAYPDLKSAAYYLTGYGAWPAELMPRLTKGESLDLSRTSFASAFDADLARPRPMYRHASALLATFLPDNNQARMDRVSMANSIETRAPFLNPKLAEFAASLPLNLKIRGSQYKYVLRRAAADFLPADIVNRPKHGFDALPMADWLRTDLHFLIERYLEPARLERQGLFDAELVQLTVDQHMRGGAFNNWWKIWLMIVLQIWLDRWT